MVQEVEMPRVKFGSVEDFDLATIDQNEQVRVSNKVQRIYFLLRVIESIKFYGVCTIIYVTQLN